MYVNGNLENEKTLQNEFSIGKNGQYSIQDSQISVSDSEIIIGAYVSKLRDDAKITDKFIGKIASVDVYTEVLNAEQVAYKYETELLEIHKIISLYETIQIGDQTNLLYEFIKDEKSYRISLQDTIQLDDSILVRELDNTVHLNEFLNIQENVLITNTAVRTFNVILDEILSLEGNVIAMNPFAPLVNPEIQMIKSGFLITENPKFELEYYSENDAAKIDHIEIVNATSIANKVQENLATTPGELLTNLDNNSISTAIQVIETRSVILELEEQVEQIPDDVKIEDIKQLQEKVEEVTESIEDSAKRLEETH